MEIPLKTKRFIFSPSFLIILILCIYLWFCWFVSEAMRATKLDNYILYYVDEMIRYFYANISLHNPLVFLNPYAKPLSMIISNLFLHLFPFKMVSLRIMNALFSTGVLFLVFRLMRRLDFEDDLIILAIMITATFPSFFLVSFSTLSEPAFSFFLILAVYLYYSKRYFLSALIISLSPLIRQEGVLYLFVWFFLMLRDCKKKYVFLIFMPIFLWIIADKIILGHFFLYVFLFMPKISAGLPPDSLLNINDIKLSYFIGYIPMAFLFFNALKIHDKKNFLILAVTLLGLFLVVFLNIFVFLFNRHLVYELRFLTPVIPLISIYVSYGCGQITNKYIRNKELIKLFLSITVILLVFMNLYQIKQLQKLPYIKESIVTVEQEVNIRIAGAWLKDYLKKEGVKNVCYREMSDKIMRRILISLPGNMQFYVLGSNYDALNVVTFKLEPLPKTKSIYITINKEDGVPKKLNLSLIKEFALIPIYIYHFDN